MHGDSSFATGRVFDQKIDLVAENPTFGIDLLNSQLAANQFILADRRERARQRVIETDFDGLVTERLNNERRRDLRNAC